MSRKAELICAFFLLVLISCRPAKELKQERAYLQQRKRNRNLIAISLAAVVFAFVAVVFGIQSRKQTQVAKANQLAAFSFNQIDDYENAKQATKIKIKPISK